jgi:hypothetical protein
LHAGDENKILVRKCKVERLCVRTRHSWEDNVKMDVREIGMRGCSGFNWLRLEFKCESL